MVRSSDNDAMSDTKLWGPAELARFLGYTESTVARMASAEPHKLPPRVAALHRPRWVPAVCLEWALANTPGGAPQRRKPGRPRKSD